jgi:OFA family oxalate/formate antiporter-like MFS transporter
MEEM